ncbi:MAG TPA: response regulator transcription factor [Thermoleophilaceae bacterium]
MALVTRGPHIRTRVLLVDGRDVVQLGFRQLLDGEPWVERLLGASSPAQALAIVRSLRPQVAVLGAGLPVHRAAELCAALRAESAALRVLIVATEPISRQRARNAGADGTVPATWRGREIAGAIRTVALGMSLFAAESDTPRGLLTRRELEVLELIGAGATNREIAQSLTLSTNTIKDHTTALYRKMQARNRADAVVRARDLGLLA